MRNCVCGHLTERDRQPGWRRVAGMLLGIALGATLSLALPAGGQDALTGTLFLLNDSGRTFIAGNQAVTDNGKPLASLPRASYVELELAPGRHVLRTDPFLWKQEVVLDVTAGQRYYVVVAYRPERSWAQPFAGTPLLLKPLPEADARVLMRDMQALGP